MTEKDHPPSPPPVVNQAPTPAREEAVTAEPSPMPHIAALSWKTNPRILFRAILGLNDSAHSIALGTAIGLFIGLTPTVGMQMALVMIVAVLTRRFFYFNRIAALIMVYVSNPITTIPMYYAEYKFGQLFVNSEPVEYERFGKLLKPDELSTFEWWQQDVWPLIIDIGLPLLTGSTILAVVFGLLAYPFMLKLVRSFRGEKAHDEVSHPPSKTSSPTSAPSLSTTVPAAPSNAESSTAKALGSNLPHTPSART